MIIITVFVYPRFLKLGGQRAKTGSELLHVVTLLTVRAVHHSRSFIRLLFTSMLTPCKSQGMDPLTDVDRGFFIVDVFYNSFLFRIANDRRCK